MPSWKKHYHPLLRFPDSQRLPIQSSNSCFKEWFISTLLDLFFFFRISTSRILKVSPDALFDESLPSFVSSLQIRFMTSHFNRGSLIFHVPSPRADSRYRSLLYHTVGKKPMLQSQQFSLLDHVRHRWCFFTFLRLALSRNIVVSLFCLWFTMTPLLFPKTWTLHLSFTGKVKVARRETFDPCPFPMLLRTPFLSFMQWVKEETPSFGFYFPLLEISPLHHSFRKWFSKPSALFDQR